MAKMMVLRGIKINFIVFLCFFYVPVLWGALVENTHGYIVPDKTKTANGITVEHIVLYPQETHDSLKRIARNGVLARSDGAKATILISHGFMCDKYDVGMLRKIFKKHQFNVMTFDFRAHGEDSGGQYCTFGRDEALDVIAAAQFLRKHPELADKPLFGYGFSMGAVSNIEAQALVPELFDAMILDCPFDSSERVIKTGLEGLKCSVFGYEFDFPGKELLIKYAFHPYVQSLVKAVLKTVAQMDATCINTNFCPLHPAESVKKITIPLFFIHCKNDQKVTVDQVKQVYAGAAGYKRLWLTNGRRHYDSFFYNPEKYTEQVRQFYNQVMNGDISAMPQEGVVEDDEDDAHLFG
ncbi:MAG TPA: alpha/beta hydrolase [Candidatus Babeliales bacterium]|nr:alpha/beta hydrolase [Candidatus Babeliales bacterium]